MPEDPTATKKSPGKPKAAEPAEPVQQPGAAVDARGDSEELVTFDTYEDAVMSLLNEVAQLSAPYLDDGAIGMVTLIVVSADGTYSRAHEVLKLPESAGDNEAEKARIHRMNASARLQTAIALKKHGTRLNEALLTLIQQLDA